MKFRLFLLASLTTWLAHAQGTLLFYNHVPTAGVDAPVLDINGVTRASGERYFAQLYAGPDSGRLTPVGTPRPFQTGAGAGYWQPDVVVIPQAAPGAKVTVQVRAWIEGVPLAKGFSNIFTVDTGGTGAGDLPPAFPAYLTGLQPFRIEVIPEPATAALGALGAAMLLGGSGRRRHA